MRWGHRYSALVFIIGLTVIQSRKEDEDQTQFEVGSLEEGGVNAVNSFKPDQSFSAVNNQTEPEPTPKSPTSSATKNNTVSEKEREATTYDAYLEPLSVKVLYGESNALSISDMSDLKHRLPPLLNQTNINIYSVDFHWNKGLIFFTTENKIYRARILGKHALSEVQVIASDTKTARLAVDWVHDRLFWMSDKYQSVEVADLDGANRALIIDNVKPFKYPNNIAVDPYKNALFFVSDYSVFKSFLNGSHVERLVVDYNNRGEKHRGVRCLALDRRRQKLYLTGQNVPEPDTNINSTYITTVNYDGSKMVELQDAAKTRHWSDVFGIDVFRDTLYLAHYESNFSYGHHPDSLWTVNLTTNMAEKKFSPKCITSGLWSIRVYHPLIQRISDQETNEGPV